MNRSNALQVEEPGFEVISSGRSYRCAAEGCENRVLGMGERCCECLDEAGWLTVVRSPAARAARREKWDRRAKTALELWLTLWDWLRTCDLVSWILAIFVAWAVGYLIGVYSDMWVDWLAGMAGR